MSARPPFDDGREDAFDHEPPSADIRAGEYVLGVLDAAQRREAEARIAREPEFAARVAAWEHTLSALLDGIAPVEPGAHVWPRVRRAIGVAPAASADAPWWRRVGVWQGATAFATAAAIAAIVVGRVPPVPDAATVPPVIVAEAEPTPEVPMPVTRLLHEDGTPGWMAAVDTAKGTVTMTPIPQHEPPAGTAGELWVIAPGSRPVSLGVVSMTHMHTIDVPDAARPMLVRGAVLAITMEPEAGIPHAAPTTAPIARGEVVLG